MYFGSALTGAGIESLKAGVVGLLPAAAGDPAGPVSARVFKIERDPDGGRVAYVRMFSGALRVRDRLPEGKVTATTSSPTGPPPAATASSRARSRRCGVSPS